MPPTLPPPPGGNSTPEYIDRFAQEIEAIKLATQQTATLVPKALSDLSEKLAKVYDVYANAGPSRGTAATGPVGGRSGGSTLENLDATTTQARARQQLADENEAALEGRTPTGTPRGPTWRDRVAPGGVGNVLTLPRYPGVEPNAQDMLNYASTLAANVAQKRQNVLDKRAKPIQQARLREWEDQGLINLDDQGQPTEDLPPELQNQFDALKAPDTKLGKVSDLFASAEGAYTQGRYLKGMVSKVLRPANDMRQLGYETGSEGGSPGFMGLRSPFDSAVQAGVGQRVSEMGFAMDNNVSPAQAGTIYNNLFGQGWYGGGSTNDMRQAGAQMMQQNPYIASMPQYYEMMDKATRMGASSLATFNDAMMKVPDASKAAHTSIVDTISAMDQLGQQNKSIGGTYMGGVRNAVDWQTNTGLPATVMGQLMQNPMVIGQTFRATGLIPQEQGLATPYQHAQGIYGALNLMNRAIVTPTEKQNVDPITGLSNPVSGQDQKEALISNLYGVDKATVHTMLANQKGPLSGLQISSSADAYQTSVNNAARSGQMAQSLQDLTGAPWQRLRGALGKATDSQGHKVFEDWTAYDNVRNAANKGGAPLNAHEQAIAHKYAQRTALTNIQRAGDTAVLRDAGFKPEQIRQLNANQKAEIRQKLFKDKNVSKKMMSDVAAARKAEIQHYQTMNTQKFGPGNQNNNGPSLQIELGPAAKKVFHLSDPNGQQKANANAGSASVNLNSYVNGPTAAPMPNLSTASGSGSSTMSGTGNYGGPLTEGPNNDGTS